MNLIIKFLSSLLFSLIWYRVQLNSLQSHITAHKTISFISLQVIKSYIRRKLISRSICLAARWNVITHLNNVSVTQVKWASLLMEVIVIIDLLHLRLLWLTWFLLRPSIRYITIMRYIRKYKGRSTFLQVSFKSACFSCIWITSSSVCSRKFS